MSQENVAAIPDKSSGIIGQVESPDHPATYHPNYSAGGLDCWPKDFIPDKQLRKAYLNA
ncbi:hypothetical protein I5907_19375 [Panacibacter sp. DH6]|uniref:Uncharacterized protein n=1 Tax=Panacibacter microcysteis TaxID=2793269 RepID=A0A931H000_9BACT|nr:hypothetical protein [Panacibacter microcysteis]MBG9378408.1 hypothetical protein [Panacibacter microcysteis]